MSRPRPHTPASAAFTLVELLVVITIIALLMALLLPVLGNSRLIAQSVQCQSNQRQLSIALNNYMGDNSDYAMVLLDNTLDNLVGRPIPGGIAAMPNFPMPGTIGGGNNMYWLWNFQIWNYTQDYAAFLCPSSKRTVTNLLRGGSTTAWNINNQYGFVYGYNLRLSGTRVGTAVQGKTIRNASSWRAPSKTSAFGDVRNWYSVNLGDGSGDFKVTPYQAQNWGNDTAYEWTAEQASRRHINSRVNVAFADGHGESLEAVTLFTTMSPPTFLPPSSFYWQNRFWDPTR